MQVKPAPVLLADYTILLSLHGIIAAGRLLYLFLPPDDAQALPAPVPMVNYTIPLSLHGIIAAGRLLCFIFLAGRSAGETCSRPVGRLYHSAVASWYNSRRAAIILIFTTGRCAGSACSRPNGQLYHSAVASWYNSRGAAIMFYFSGRTIRR